MNMTMPYRSFRSQSRVEFIKKKFESSFSEENGTGSLKRTNSNPPKQSNFIQQLKDLSLDQKVVGSKSETGFGADDVPKSDGKALIKRSPAFRREKLGPTKSLTQITFQKSETFSKLETNSLNDNAQKKILKSEVNELNEGHDLKRSKTDTNLLQYCSSRKIDKRILTSNSENSNFSNSLVFSENKDSKCDPDEKTVVHYSTVKKKKNDADKNEGVNLRFSESIRRALQTPLPKGPPPKKPPRTFCHVQCFTKSNSLTNDSNASSVIKTDIPKLKSKLEKLENIIRIHETGTCTDKLDDTIKQKNENPGKLESCSVPDVADTCQSCLPIPSCQKFIKLSKAKSEFYIEVDKANSKSGFWEKKDCFIGSTSDKVSVKINNSEAVYDVPYINKKNSFKTFGKLNKHLKDSAVKKKEDLHYMCTDVIKCTPEIQIQSDFISPAELANSGEEIINENQMNILNLNCSLKREKQQLSSLNRINSVGEHANDLIIRKSAGKRNESVSGTDEENSMESETEFLSINSSDCNEAEKKNKIKNDIFSRMTAQRKIYVSTVSSKLKSQVPCWNYKSKNSYKHLFECCLLVGLSLSESKQNMPYIRSVFPPDTKPPPLIEFLCFPDASYWPPTSKNYHPEEQYYSLVVTNESGERKFGYCRRVLPEGSHVCLPLAYCIMSPHRAGGFFYKVLEELESRHGSPDVDNFIKQLYEAEFPGPGERLKLKEILEEATRANRLNSVAYHTSTLVRRPPDLRLEEKDLTQLLQHLQLPVFLKVFSSILHERKILLLSHSIRNLSSCIESLHSILLPFTWQHTYIPILPVHLIEMCEAPIPYVIGLLKTKDFEKSLTNLIFEDGILVDLDDSKILKCCGDEGTILPSRFVRDLKTSLNLAMNATDFLSESVRSVLISDAFIKFFVQVCGNYSKFIQNLPSGEKIFQKEEFLKSATSNATQSFLDWFTETAMFNSFIHERLQGDDDGPRSKTDTADNLGLFWENSENHQKSLKDTIRKLRDTIAFPFLLAEPEISRISSKIQNLVLLVHGAVIFTIQIPLDGNVYYKLYEVLQSTMAV